MFLSSRDELARLIEQLETGESGTDKSGSATPAVTGSGASSDTEGTVSDCVVSTFGCVDLIQSQSH